MQSPTPAPGATTNDRNPGSEPAAIGPASSPAGPERSTTDSDSASVLADVDAAIEARREAAADLVAVVTSSEPGNDTSRRFAVATRAVRETLSGTASDPTAVALLLERLAASPSAPYWLTKPLTELAKRPEPSGEAGSARRVDGLDGSIAVWAVRAMGSVRSRESARALIDLTSGAEPVASEAYAALARLAGEPGLGNDPARWSQWYARVQWLTEAQWRERLTNALARRADQLSRESRGVSDRLLESLRARCQDVESVGQRSAIIASYIRDDLAPVRELGLSLATQELANARQLAEPVSGAAAEALQDRSPQIRTAAASLLRLIAGPDHGPLVAEALKRETDDAATLALLQCVPRVACGACVEPVLARLEAGPAITGAAIDAAWELRERKLLDDASLGSLREKLARISDDALTSSQRERRSSMLAP